MDRKLLIMQVVEAISEVVKSKKECEIVSQYLSHSRSLLEEAVRDKDDRIDILMALKELRGASKISEEAYKVIIKQIASLHKDQAHFLKACHSILDRT